MRRLARLTLTPLQYRQVAELALVFLTLIVFTGAAVRLSGSGLGCPDWPKCFGGVAPPLKTHAIIEYGNRILSGFVGLAAVAAGALAFRRRPFRRDLARLGVLLPLGVLGQAVLALGAAVIFVGTAATAAGPHAGGAGTGDEIDRLEWRGSGTLDWAIHQHGRIATLLGLAAIGVWLLLRRRGAEPEARRAVTVACVLLAVQGAVGGIQYQLELPAEIVWIHVALAACLWLTLLWATAAVSSLAPRGSVRIEPHAVADEPRLVRS
jgi:cytochrome c oxidase assembly protein subunit 15